MSDEVDKFLDGEAVRAAASLSQSNPRWLGHFASKTAIKADGLQKENELLISRIEQLEAELAAERLVAKNNLDWFNALETDYDASRAKVAKLREVLEPFAGLLVYPDDLGPDFVPDQDDINEYEKEAEWIRRARAVLEETGGDD